MRNDLSRRGWFPSAGTLHAHRALRTHTNTPVYPFATHTLSYWQLCATNGDSANECVVWVVCDTITMSGSGSSVRQNSEDASAAECTIRSKDIRFNTKTYQTWQQASDACAALQSKAKSGSVWGRLSKFEKGDAGSAEFELRCQKCGTQCQLANPAKWHKDRTEDACVKRAKKAPGFKRQAVTSSMVHSECPADGSVH
jgi:hypothetical protein